MKISLNSTLILGGLLLAAAPLAQAQVTGTVYENVPDPGNAADPANYSSSLANAGFTSPAVNYDSRVTGYTVSDFLNNPSFYNEANGFDPNSDGNGSGNWEVVLTGNIFLNAGDNNFSVLHDDGLTLNINGIGQVVDSPDPSSPSELPFDVVAPTNGNYSFTLDYVEADGPPAVLEWDINQQPVAVGVPDACSTLGLLGLGVGSLGAVARRLKK